MAFFQIILVIRNGEVEHTENHITKAKDKKHAKITVEEYIKEYFGDEPYVLKKDCYRFKNINRSITIDTLMETTVDDWKTMMYENCRIY